MKGNQANNLVQKRVRFQIPVETADFDQFLRINIHAADYIRLEEILQTTPHHLTKLKNDPAIITDAEVATLAPLLRITPGALWNKIKFYSTK
jgi:hypothetical protein